MIVFVLYYATLLCSCLFRLLDVFISVAMRVFLVICALVRYCYQRLYYLYL